MKTNCRNFKGDHPCAPHKDTGVHCADCAEYDPIKTRILVIKLIAGHGEEEYEKYLRDISSRLIEQGKLAFTGYLTGREMLRLYQASDLFISTSTSEGSPVSVMKAIACETPVMCTRVGGVDDILAEHNAGILVDPLDYNQWKKELIAVLEGKEIKTLDREIARQYFHWPNIAEKFVNIYERLQDV